MRSVEVEHVLLPLTRLHLWRCDEYEQETLQECHLWLIDRAGISKIWYGKSGKKQVLAKTNKAGNKLIFVKARRPKVRRKIEREFNHLLTEHKKKQRARYDDLVNVFNRNRQDLYYAYHEGMDTLFCHMKPSPEMLQCIKDEEGIEGIEVGELSEWSLYLI